MIIGPLQTTIITESEVEIFPGKQRHLQPSDKLHYLVPLIIADFEKRSWLIKILAYLVKYLIKWFDGNSFLPRQAFHLHQSVVLTPITHTHTCSLTSECVPCYPLRSYRPPIPESRTGQNFQ